MRTRLAVLALFLMPCYSSLAQQGWSWQNPLPQGNNLYDIGTSPGLTIAVGSYGTILTNTGSGWQIRDGDTREYLFSVAIRGSHIWVGGSNGLILHSSDGNGATWESQSSGVTRQIRSVFFLDESLGWGVGEAETIIRTTNGGASWQVVNTNGTQHYFGVYFHDANNGWLAGAAGSNGVVKKSTDGGVTWVNSIIPTSRMNAIAFGDANFGCVVGDAGRIFRTTNGGANWSLGSSASGSNLQDVYLTGTGIGWAVGTTGAILTTTDTGATWNEQTSGVRHHLKGIAGAWIAGEGGTILQSADGGTSWGLSSSGFTSIESQVLGISFVTDKLGYAVGMTGQIHHTTDGGISWVQQSSGTTRNLYGVHFRQFFDLTGIGSAVGEPRGSEFTYIRTSDGGQTWIDKSFTISNVGFGQNLYACYKMLGKTFVVGRFGTIASTTDGGDTWNIHKMPHQSYDLWDIDFESEYVGWAVGSSGTVLKTVDKGVTWFHLNPDTLSNFRSVYFADLRHGWVVGVGGVIYRTTDGGYNWTKTTPNVTYERLNDVYFINRDVGWIAGASGTILHTQDGGIRWSVQESGTDNELTSMSFATSATGWIVGWIGGWNNTILHSDDGGGVLAMRSFWKYARSLTLADGGETTDDMTVALGKRTLDAGALAGVAVVIDTVLHPEVSELTFLLSHNGVTDTLLAEPSSPGANIINCTLSDAAANLLTEGAPPYSGSYRPHQPLSVFSGMDPAGTWTLRIIDGATGNTGTLEAWGLTFFYGTATHVVSYENVTPSEFFLHQNYPNPFNPSTTIRWQLPEDAFTTLRVFDLLGREVQVLVNEELRPGLHEYQFTASGLSSGVYFYRLQAGDRAATRKFVLIR